MPGRSSISWTSNVPSLELPLACPRARAYTGSGVIGAYARCVGARAMQEARKLVEYGVPIDPEVMVSPPEATELELEPGHPGLGDPFYIQRRKNLFALCRRHRLEELGPPLIDYTAEETRIWRDVSPK